MSGWGSKGSGWGGKGNTWGRTAVNTIANDGWGKVDERVQVPQDSEDLNGDVNEPFLSKDGLRCDHINVLGAFKGVSSDELRIYDYMRHGRIRYDPRSIPPTIRKPVGTPATTDGKTQPVQGTSEVKPTDKYYFWYEIASTPADPGVYEKPSTPVEVHKYPTIKEGPKVKSSVRQWEDDDFEFKGFWEQPQMKFMRKKESAISKAQTQAGPTLGQTAARPMGTVRLTEGAAPSGGSTEGRLTLGTMYFDSVDVRVNLSWWGDTGNALFYSLQLLGVFEGGSGEVTQLIRYTTTGYDAKKLFDMAWQWDESVKAAWSGPLLLTVAHQRENGYGKFLWEPNDGIESIVPPDFVEDKHVNDLRIRLTGLCVIFRIESIECLRSPFHVHWMKIEVRPLNEEEVRKMMEIAIEKEHWTESYDVIPAFLALDKGGFFGGFIGDDLIGTVSVVRYAGNDYAFVGYYIVAEELRSHGIGLRIWEEGMQHASDCKVIGLDAVEEHVDKYARSGFKAKTKHCRYSGVSKVITPVDNRVKPYDDSMLDDVVAYDEKYFPCNRRDLLKAWLEMKNGAAFVFWENETVRGYGAIHKTTESNEIAPCIAENSEIARAIYRALINTLGGGVPVHWNIAGNNPESVRLVESLGEYVPRYSWYLSRMYKYNGDENTLNVKTPESAPNVWSLLSFSIG